MGYATMLSSRVQQRMSNEKSRLAVSRNLISTASISLLKYANERLKERCERFTSSCKRQISSRQKDLLNQRRRFQPDRFNRRIRQEYECLCDWRSRFLLRFRSELNIRNQQSSHLSGRFKLESMIAFLENEKYKLATKAATLRAADPDTSLKRGFSLVYTQEGDLVRSLTQINVSDTMTTEIGDGRIFSTVNRTERKSSDREPR